MVPRVVLVQFRVETVGVGAPDAGDGAEESGENRQGVDCGVEEGADLSEGAGTGVPLGDAPDVAVDGRDANGSRSPLREIPTRQALRVARRAQADS